MRRARIVAGAALLVSSSFVHAGAAPLSSQRDYSINAEHHAPVTCRDGDISLFRGKTLAEVFGADWPEQPEPASADARHPARAVALGRLIPPRGLSGRAVVVVATLVGADGAPLRSEVLCATRPGVDMAAKRSAKTARYEPARIDGQPVTSVAISTYVFQPPTLRMPQAGDD